jgi:hypothetical protein
MTIRPKTTVHEITGEEVECWVAEGLDDALMGYGEQAGQTVAVYDYEKCLDIFVKRDGMDRDEAAEHMSYNVAGTYLPGKTPVFLERFTPEETEAFRRPAGWA